MRPACIIGVLAVLTPPAMSARFQCLPDQTGAGEDEQARDRNELAARTKMAAGKKTSDDADNMLATNPATDPAGAGCARIDDIPDRLLILANRLQKALDSRRAVAGDGGR
ncbi:hypothetical protein BC374_20255 [Ensifer sp. LC13]|nr:hypothetical protein BC374_20255 [Ensifer sp. LC13]OCP31582.1 hypothetical protein BC364_23240 [Ensifer sp. LC499]